MDEQLGGAHGGTRHFHVAEVTTSGEYRSPAFSQMPGFSIDCVNVSKPL
jgi:hypothetical protein